MNPFYQSLIGNIHSLVRAQRPEQAHRLIEENLSESDVPQEIRNQLEAMKSLSAAPELPFDEKVRLDELMKGSLAAKEKAVTILLERNLSRYAREVQTLLDDPQLISEFKGELIRELVRQRTEETFHVFKDGLDYTFTPALIPTDCADPVLIQTQTLLEDWLKGSFVLSSDFAGQLLEQEVLETMPEDFSGVDPQSLAAAIVRLVFLAMKDEEGWEAFQKEHSLEHVKPYPLKIEKRGECL